MILAIIAIVIILLIIVLRPKKKKETTGFQFSMKRETERLLEEQSAFKS